MKKIILSAWLFMGITLFSTAQSLDSFTIIIQTKEDGNNYLNIVNKKTYSFAEAMTNKTAIDFALIINNDHGKQKTEWYNMSGKDNVVPKKLIGTSTLINAISFDRDQFDKCKTVADLKRMTGHITGNALSHFAVIRNGNDYYQRCFLFQKANGKRGLLFVTETENNQLKVEAKVE